MDDENLSAVVNVADLEKIIKTLTITSPVSIWNDEKARDSYFRLCAAIAAARDMAGEGESPATISEFVSDLAAKNPAGGDILQPTSPSHSPVYAEQKIYKFKVKWGDEGVGINSKLASIKLVREVFGWGLVQAKKAVEEQQELSLPTENHSTLLKLAKQHGVEIVPCN